MQTQDELLNLTQLREKYKDSGISSVSKAGFIELLYPPVVTSPPEVKATTVPTPTPIKVVKPPIDKGAEAKKELAKAQKKAADVLAARIKNAQLTGREDYLPALNERHVYHVKMDHMKFDENTGEKKSIAFVQMFNTKEWAMFLENGKKTTGYKTEILWDPTKY